MKIQETLLNGSEAVIVTKAGGGKMRETLAGATFWKGNALSLASLVLTLALGAWVLAGRDFGGRKMAFVDTGRVMTAFKDANKANKEIETEDSKWKADMKQLEEGLKAYMDTMSAKFDAADAKRKREMQDELSARNQQINNFERANTKRMQELAQKKLSGVFEKINAFMKEFGKAQGYEVVFGTAQGNILYGEGTAADITDQVIAQLNQRYE